MKTLIFKSNIETQEIEIFKGEEMKEGYFKGFIEYIIEITSDMSNSSFADEYPNGSKSSISMYFRKDYEIDRALYTIISKLFNNVEGVMKNEIK